MLEFLLLTKKIVSSAKREIFTVGIIGMSLVNIRYNAEVRHEVMTGSCHF